MYKYGQYCPVAKAAEILGDRWTLLIVRDLLTGTHHFNELERGLPGISRGLLAERLRRLQRMGVIEKWDNNGKGSQRTEYQLTQAGHELKTVIDELLTWGTRWAFGAPEPSDLDPELLLWWIHNRVDTAQLPAQRVVTQFDFKGAVKKSYWLVLTKEDVSVCRTHPGFEVNVLVSADLSIFYQIWLGRMNFFDALQKHLVHIDAIPSLAEAFPNWFTYSHAAPIVRSITAKLPVEA